MKTRVILVNFEYPPIAGPGIWRVFALSRDLHALGHDVTVVCSDRSSWHELRDESLLATIPAAVRVVRLHAPLLADWRASLQARAQAANGQLARRGWEKFRHLLEQYIPDPAIAWAWQAARAVRSEVARGSGPVAVITSGPAHVSQWVGLAASLGGRTRWIMDYRDLWTGDPMHTYAGPYQRRALRWLERTCLRRCDAVVSVAPAWLDDLRQVAGAGSALDAKLRVIRNGHDLTPALVARLTSAHVPDPRLRLHFSGTLQTGTRLAARALFEALAQLRTQRPDLPLPRVTFTGISARIAETIHALALDDVIVDVGYRTQDEAQRLSAEADALLVLVDAEGSGRAGIIPAKTYESMALGRHVFAIVPQHSDVRPLLDDYGNATVCGQDRAAIARALEALLDRHVADPMALQQVAAGTAQMASQHSRRAAAEAFSTLIEAR